MRTVQLLLIATLVVSGAFCQTVPPQTSNENKKEPLYTYQPAQFYAFAGAGYTDFDHRSTGAVQAGAGGGFFPLMTFEGAYLGPANRAGGSGVFAINSGFLLHGLSAFSQSANLHNAVFVTGGYAQIFGRGHGVDYGIGVDHILPSKTQYSGHALRFEIRNYMRLQDRIENNVALRIAFVFTGAD